MTHLFFGGYLPRFGWIKVVDVRVGVGGMEEREGIEHLDIGINNLRR